MPTNPGGRPMAEETISAKLFVAKFPRIFCIKMNLWLPLETFPLRRQPIFWLCRIIWSQRRTTWKPLMSRCLAVWWRLRLNWRRKRVSLKMATDWSHELQSTRWTRSLSHYFHLVGGEPLGPMLSQGKWRSILIFSRWPKMAQRFVDQLAQCRRLGLTVLEASEHHVLIELPYSTELIGYPDTGLSTAESLLL